MVAVKHLTLATLFLAVAELSVAAPLVSPSPKEAPARPIKGKFLSAAGSGLKGSITVPQLNPQVVQNGQQQRDLEAVVGDLVARSPKMPKNQNRNKKNRNKGNANRKYRTKPADIESRDINEAENIEVRDMKPVNSYLVARAITNVDSLIANAHERDLELVGNYLALREIERRGIFGKAVKAIGGGAKKLASHVDWAKVGAAAGRRLNSKLRSREVGGMEEIEARDVDELIKRGVNDAFQDSLLD